MSAPIQVACTFDSATRRKDKSLRLAFTSNLEISTEDYMHMDRLLQQAGWCIFSPNELKLEDIPAHDAPTEERKSKGQRLRAINFLLWRKLGTEEPFETWWDRSFENLMQKYKDRLDG